MQPVQQCTWEWSVRQNLTGSGGKVHKTLWGLWIDVQASRTGRCFFFFFFPSAEVSDYLQTKILLLFCSITTCWVLNDAIHSPSAIFFFSPSPSLSVHFACVFHLVGLGRLALNKCHFFFPPPLFQVALFSLQIHSSFQYLFSPSLLLSLSLPLFFFPQAGGFYFTPLSS